MENLKENINLAQVKEIKNSKMYKLGIFGKKTIIIIGGILLLMVFLLNTMFISQISDNLEEKVTIQANSILMIFVTTIMVLGISILLKKVEKINKKWQIVIICIIVILYFVCQIIWIQVRQATPVADQRQVYNATVNIYNGNWENLKVNKYLERFPQQLTLAVLYSAIFRIFGESVKVLQYVNAVANTFSLIAILLITKQLSKKYEVNINKTLLLMSTFLTLPMLSTFIYGDFISLPMCLFAIYFIMKYGECNKVRYAIISAMFISLAYIARMNNLIYIIALLVYLVLDILSSEKKLIKIPVILAFIVIAILPTSIIKTVVQNKLEFSKKEVFPTTGFLCMGMTESYRANGWYNVKIASIANEEKELAKKIYINAIKIRVSKFIKNPLYAIRFYVSKIASMWTENTYSAIWYNQTFNFYRENEEDLEKKALDDKLKNARDDIVVYQKVLVLIIFGSTLLVLIEYKDKLSNEALLLITIFIGGFLFHVLWEAKSRYIISYIIVLIPIASIVIFKPSLCKIKNGEKNEKL